MNPIQSLKEIKSEILDNQGECVSCRKLFNRVTKITCWGPHDGGIFVRSGKNERNEKVTVEHGKQWVYMICTKCGYQNALWKIRQRIQYKKQLAADKKDYAPQNLAMLKDPESETKAD